MFVFAHHDNIPKLTGLSGTEAKGISPTMLENIPFRQNELDMRFVLSIQRLCEYI